MSEAWTAWLGTLDAAALTALLERRPDVARGVPPLGLAELAERLLTPHSLTAALQQLPLPALHLVEAAQALGGEVVRRDELAWLLDGDGAAHLAAVDEVIGWLSDVGVVIALDDGGVALPAAFETLFANALGLGEPLRVLLRDVPVDAMRRQSRAFGLPKAQQNRAITFALLVDAFQEPGRVASIVAGAPTDVVAELAAALSPDDDPYGYDARAYRRREDAVAWARSAGLLVDSRYGGGLRVPSEVARVLLGPSLRAPFAPEPPALQSLSVDPDRIAQESSAAASAFAAATLAVLDRVARGGVPTVAAGGVGARELAKLAKATGVSEVEARVVLELAYAAGLVGVESRRLEVTADFAGFRDGEPAERFVTLLEVWRLLGATPTEARDEDGKAIPVAARRADCGGCRAARLALLDTLADAGGAVARDSALRRALWRRPLVHPAAAGDGLPLGAAWQEAELLGVVALGALTPLGRALGDGASLRAVAVALLPPSIDVVTFGADLTAYVAGAPSSRVSVLLDSAADRESGGGAVTWRFGPASVRRALDDGTSGERLTTELTAVASTELPQALRVLIGDVARRHGDLRLTPAVCVVRSEDVPLLAEVVRDRRLKALGLRTVTPTVLVGELPLDATLAALRKAGYFPLSDGPAAEVPERPSRDRHRRPVRVAAEVVDLAALARQLVRSPDSAARPVSITERLLSAAATSLSPSEVRLLAHAVDTGGSVGVGYESTSGAYTERVVRAMELNGGVIAGWCELRQDDRTFAVRGIVSVRPV